MNWNTLRDPVFRLLGACAFFAAMVLASAAQAAPPSAGMWKVQVKSVIMDSRTNQPIVVLEDKKTGAFFQSGSVRRKPVPS